MRGVFAGISILILCSSSPLAEAQTSLKDIIESAGGGEQEVQDRAYNRQTLAARQRVLNADDDKELAFQIANSRLIQYFQLGDPADLSQALYTMDVVAAYEDDPDLTLRLLKPHSSSLFSIRDKRGDLVSAYPVKISPVASADGASYRVEFKIVSSSKGPFQWKGEPLPEKNTLIMTRQQLNDIAAMRLAQMASDGALESIELRLRALEAAEAD